MIDITILIVSWIIAIVLFYFLVAASKLREAILGFLSMQVLTWPLGYLVVELNLIRYPVRVFETATQSSFTYEFFVFPIVSALYNLYYPRDSKVAGFLYTGIIVSVLTGAEVILEKFTDTIEYINWEWYYSWISMFIVLYISYGIWKWFLNKE
ncbi:CBO0543 family protein [Bacillus sinesaloumensis]|uniref:CBO0543 family protein n=1 Tax=Litchfieldia sinesaloumensis TaxID=1926280 RepID=UPI00098833A9|nr:CBO0543 family protein [Bacillus sinesaloumensis]